MKAVSTSEATGSAASVAIVCKQVRIQYHVMTATSVIAGD